MVRCGPHLDEGIIAADRCSRSFQRFAHEKRTRGCRCTRERDQVEAGQSLSAGWYSVFSEIALRRIEREAYLSKFAADKFRSTRARKSDGEIGIATCNVERANAQHQIDLQIRMSLPQCADSRYDHLIR